MGQQIHIGGFRSSMDLAEKAGIGAGMSGVDLCCCNGAGMRFLVRFRNVARMHGVDATPTVIAAAAAACEAEGLADRITFMLADACRHGPARRRGRFRLGRGRLVLRGRQAGADRRGRPPGQARRHDRLHRLDRRARGPEPTPRPSGSCAS